jgi:hypothetical protein
MDALPPGSGGGGIMLRRAVLTGAAVVLLLGLTGLVAIAAAPQAVEPSADGSKTLTFDVVFSPFTLVATNNVRDPNSPFALGDEVVFHDQLLSNGKQVGDDVGHCVIVSLPDIANDCTVVFRLPGGDITGQFATVPGGAPKPIALTGGTGIYHNVGGEATLVEPPVGNVGSVTLHVLSFAPRAA